MAVSQKPWIPKTLVPDLLLINARVVDPSSGSSSDPTTILISNGKIKSVSASLRQETEIQKVDLQGRYLCPGLIDCHVHLTAAPGPQLIREMFAEHPDTLAYRTVWNTKQMLLRGFTTVRDTGGANFALRDAISENLIQGPRLFFAGKALSQTGGHGDFRQPYQDDTFKCCNGHGPGLSRVCDGVPECLAAARDELRKGADFLKIMVGGGVASPSDPLEMLQFTPEEIQAITNSAANLGKYVTAHAYTNEAIRLAIENGVKGIEHANFINEATAKLCAKKGVFVTPTLATYSVLTSPPFADFMPEQSRAKCQVVIESGVAALKILRDAGVTMCFGTDLLAGMHEYQSTEFAIRAKVLDSVDVLRSATTNAAKLLGMEGQIGTLAEGAWADFLILDQDPLVDVAVLGRMDEHCFAIVKEGRVVMSRLEGDNLSVDDIYR